MNNNKHSQRKLGVASLAAALLMLPAGAALAAPGVIANAPLYTSASAPPNIMFMVDNSGSMKNIVAQAPYDSTVDYTPNPCGNSSVPLFPSADTVQLRIISGVPYVYDSSTGTKYTLGKVCFTATTIYNGELNASNGGGSTSTATNCDTTNTCQPGGTTPAKYTGNYLNWYFDTSYDTSGVTWSTQRIKPTTPPTLTRSEIARAGAKSVIASLNSSVNVGLSTYNGSDGANILVDVSKLTCCSSTSQTGLLDTAIDSSALDPSGYTPLAETLMDIGRYFLGTPSSTAKFILWPGTTNQTSVTQDTVFKHTPAAASGIDLTKSHIQYSCQKNFAVLLTDGQPTQDRQVVTSTYTGLTKEQLGDYDGDCANPPAGITCDDNTSDATFDEKTGGGYLYESGGSDYMDDVAKMLHDIDLYPSSTDPTINNLTTFMIGFADSSVRNDPLIKETAENGGGQYLTAFNATELNAAFAKATASILATTSTASAVTFNSSTLSSESAVYQALFNTGRWSGDIRAYPLNGTTGAVTTTCVLGSSNCWSAAAQLDAQTPSSRVMLTYKSTTSGAPYDYGIPFAAPANYASLSSTDFDSSELNDLCAGPGIPNPEGLANPCDTTSSAWTALSASQQTTQQSAVQTYLGQLVGYLRGDRSREGASTAPTFRVRDHVLGDIVDASPVYVGAPNLNWPDQPPFPTTTGLRYSDFKQAEQNRMGVVYAGSNDGMLHAFRATESSSGAGDAGQEIMAYIPSSVYSSSGQAGLHYLADPTYQHKYYVDGTPTVSDVYTYGRDSSGAETTTKAWRTVLLGTLRGGGAGLFLLDVTDPTQFTQANAKQIALWEFTDADDPELGESFSKPTIALMNNGRWAAIFGNGYNNGDTGGDGQAALFIVYLDGGLHASGNTSTTPPGKWIEGPGNDYIVLKTGVGSVVSGGTCASAGSNCNGLSTPALADIDGNGTVDRIYAGDLLGNIWVFDVSSTSDANWGSAYMKGSNPVPLFTAIDPSGNPQPITVQPVLATDPNNSANIIVVFGTGQYLTNSDPSNTNLQTMYGVYDTNAMSGSGSTKSGLTRSNLVAQTISTASCGTGCTVRIVSSNPIGNNQYGWYIDLLEPPYPGGTQAGERVVVNPKIRNNIVFFNTLIPDTTVCHAGGSGWLMSVDLTTGGPPPAPAFDFNHDGVVNGSDVVTLSGGSTVAPAGQQLTGGIPTESNFLSDIQYTGDSTGKINTRLVNVGTTLSEGRYSWRELRPPQ